MEQKLIPICPHPIPIPGVSKSFLPGGKQIQKTCIFDGFHVFYKKSENINEPLAKTTKWLTEMLISPVSH